ncbi:serine/threonine protein kinase, partial [Myxococcota bacterium]|nr:serine/threonine protein kinase [Myxococcota bacterium]
MSSSQRDPHTFAGNRPHEDDPLLGIELGSYRLVERLGEGASAVVYRAEHVRLGIPYAIKILHPIIASRQGMRERFLREAQAAGSLRHENVVFISDFAIDTKIGPYMVMEYLQGETLQAVLEREGALPIERARNIAKQICKALAVAHDTGIIHRDLKPENIFLLNRKGGETVKILDFGIARLAQHTHNLTGAGNIVGTPLYMSPEQCRGDGELSKSTDIYSFGVMLFQMLMGHTPFQGDHPQKLLIDHFLVPAPPLPASFPEPLRKLQAELLAKTPEERPPDMETVWRRLADALITTAPNAKEPPSPYDDGGEDDHTDLTAAFEAVPDPNAPTVSLRETDPNDFSRLSGRSLEREETDFQPRPPLYQTPHPPLSSSLSIQPLEIEYDRQTLESLPAVTPDFLAANTSLSKPLSPP